MEEIAISKFKAECLGIMEQVRRTGTGVRVTKFGKPVADIVPVAVNPKKRILGTMAGEFEVKGDIVNRIGAFDNWKLGR